MHNRNFEHTPACRESPQYCICHIQNRQGWSGTEPKIISMDNITVDPATAGLFKNTGELVQTGNVNPAGGFSVNGVVYQAQVRRNNELVNQVHLWKQTARWAATLGFACMLITVVKIAGWF